MNDSVAWHGCGMSGRLPRVASLTMLGKRVRIKKRCLSSQKKLRVDRASRFLKEFY